MPAARANSRRDALNMLHDLVDTFVEAHSESSGGGFAPVGPKDVEELSKIVELLIGFKYQRDADGDLPIEFTIVDRTRFEPDHGLLIPYAHKAKDEDELLRILSAAHTNAKIATDRVDVLINSMVHRRAELGRAARTTDEKILERLGKGEKLRMLYLPTERDKKDGFVALNARFDNGDTVEHSRMAKLVRTEQVRYKQDARKDWVFVL